MEAILPFKSKDRKQFHQSALDIGFDEFVALKFVYVFEDSDLDVYQLMGNERLMLLLYGWEVCDNGNKSEAGSMDDNFRTVVKRLVHYSLDLLFSKEFDHIKPEYKTAILLCLKRARPFIAKLSELATLNWDYLLELGIDLWNITYFKHFCENMNRPKESGRQSAEQLEEPASAEDIEFIQKEGLLLALLRLIKMFDAGSMSGVKYLSMRIIAAWNLCYEQRKRKMRSKTFPKVKAEDRNCLILSCHIYLMAIYESDDIVGFVIDNMMNNIRFYVQSMSESATNEMLEDFSEEKMEYTPARYIARTCVNLRLSAKNFLELFVFNKYDERPTTLFGIVSVSYMSYVLGNLLMEINKMNEQDFTANLKQFKRCINLYVNERESSEQFMLGELRKLDAQEISHNKNYTVKNMTNFRSKMCKGNRQSNIGNYENVDDVEEDIITVGDEDEKNERDCERRIDPVFQSIPSYAGILKYVYNVLAQKLYKGWHFAKLVLLLKIIGQELNVIETWRYHPGLSTNFMLGLEKQLSSHFEGLALIFQDYPFLEQEFWLTAFYLNPTKEYYANVVTCGRRFNSNKRRHQTDNVENVKPERPSRRSEKINLPSAKFGLLSSTMEVQEIVGMSNHDTPNEDYTPLQTALRAIRLPERIIKDLLTVTFLARHSSFAWAVNWQELRKRCKDLLTSDTYKKNLIQLNMAEANDRLKYLKIDYDKYKHRPQLDYGSIEAGYEGGNLATDNSQSDDEDYPGLDEEDDDEEEDYKQFKAAPRRKPKAEQTRREERTELPNEYLTVSTRTRGRAGRVIETAVLQEESDSKDKSDNDSATTKEKDAKEQEDSQPEPSKIESETQDAIIAISNANAEQNLNEVLQERTTYTNETAGFKPFAFIWSSRSKNIPIINSGDNLNILKNETLMQRFAKLKALKKNNLKSTAAAELDVKKLVPKTEYIDEHGTNSMEAFPPVEDSYNLETEESNLDTTEIKTETISTAKLSLDEDLPNQVQPVTTAAFEKPLPVNPPTNKYTQRQADEDDDDESASDTSTTAIRDSCEAMDDEPDTSEQDNESEVKASAELVQESTLTTGSSKSSELQNPTKEKEIVSVRSNSNGIERSDQEPERKNTEKTSIENTSQIKDKVGVEQQNGVQLKNIDENKISEADATNTETAIEPKLTPVIETENSKMEEETPATNTAIEVTIASSDDETDEQAVLENDEAVAESTFTAETAAKHDVIGTIGENSSTNQAMFENLEDSTEQTCTTEAKLEEESAERQKLKKECTEKFLEVTLRPLTISDVMKLRQPRVRVKRFDVEAYFRGNAEVHLNAAHLCEETVESPISTEKCTQPLKIKHTAAKSTALPGQKRFVSKRTRPKPSSEEFSNDSDEYTPKPKRRGRQPLKVQKNIMAVTSSATGLKFRIAPSNTSTVKVSKTPNTAGNLPIVDYIQINSSSSDDDEEPYRHGRRSGIGMCTVLSPVLEFFDEVNIQTTTSNVHNADPLYEEEMILCD